MDATALVGMLLAAGGPRELRPSGDWGLHRAVRDVWQSLARAGLTIREMSIEFTPDPDVGVRASGVDQAVWDLRRQGVLAGRGQGRAARLCVDDHRLSSFRRELLGAEPEVASILYRSATRWAAMAAAATKKASTPSASPTARVSSSTPKRLPEGAVGNC